MVVLQQMSLFLKDITERCFAINVWGLLYSLNHNIWSVSDLLKKIIAVLTMNEFIGNSENTFS